MSFNEKAIQASFYKHFSDNFSGGSQVSYDGELVNFDAMTEVVDVEMQQVDTFVHKKHSGELRREFVFVYAEVYVRKGANLYRGRELTDAVAAVWDQAEIPVYDYDSVGSPQVGAIRMKECQVFDRSRDLNDQLRTDWTKHVVQTEGTAQEI